MKILSYTINDTLDNLKRMYVQIQKLYAIVQRNWVQDRLIFNKIFIDFVDLIIYFYPFKNIEVFNN